MYEINGKTAVVTGGANGIGLATVKSLLEKGANVVMSDYNEALLVKEYEALNEVYGDKVAYKITNVAKQDQVKELVEYAVEKYGELDIMVNNAGIGGGEKIYDEEDVSIPAFKRVFDVNLNGVMYGAKYAADQMIKQGNGGAIISTSSIMGVVSSAGGCTGYSASKHAVLGMTKAWALELAPHNIRVNALCPGFITTGLVNKDTFGEAGIAGLMTQHPLSAALGRIGNPDEMAHAIIFMVENTFLTGQAIVVDGGYTVQ